MGIKECNKLSHALCVEIFEVPLLQNKTKQHFRSDLEMLFKLDNKFILKPYGFVKIKQGEIISQILYKDVMISMFLRRTK
jgi:hypothetical protein